MTVDDPAAPDLDVPRRSWAVPVIVAVLAAVVLGAGIVALSTRSTGDDPGTQPADSAAGADDPAAGPGVSPDAPAGCPATTLPAPASLPEDDVAARTDTASAALVGCTEAEGTTKAEAAGWKVRVVMQDGESQMGTMDYRVDRVGLTVDGGVITGVEVG